MKRQPITPRRDIHVPRQEGLETRRRTGVLPNKIAKACAMVCAAVLTSAAVSAQGKRPAAPSVDGHADLSGVWIVSGSPNLPGSPAYNAEGIKIWNDRKAALEKTDPATYCLPNGPVRVTTLPYKIVQTPKLVVVLSEGNTHSYRRFFLDGRPHNLEVDPVSWTGDSIGHWEGSGSGATLVVDTVGFNDKAWLDGTGKPHSEALHVIERYSRPELGRLQVQYTLEDSQYFTQPYSFTRTFVPANRELQEYFCTDKNRLLAK